MTIGDVTDVGPVLEDTYACAARTKRIGSATRMARVVAVLRVALHADPRKPVNELTASCFSLLTASSVNHLVAVSRCLFQWISYLDITGPGIPLYIAVPFIFPPLLSSLLKRESLRRVKRQN